MTRRHHQVDALRGLAIMGILLVNTLNQAYGMQSLHLGHFFHGVGAGEQLAMFLVAALAEGKFYPIFAFLFGASFALQLKGMRHLGKQESRRHFTLRLLWLMGVGVLHAVFLFFGDILFTYAMAGLFLRDALMKRPSAQLDLLKVMGMFLAVVMLISLLESFGNSRNMLEELLADSNKAFQLVGAGSWGALAWSRVQGFAMVQFSSLFFLPLFFSYFLLGSLAVRLGWLTRPLRHRRQWGRVLILGVAVGLPLNIVFGAATLSMALDPLERHAWQWLAIWMSGVAGFFFAAAYVGAFMLFCRRPPKGMQAIGRMALTNYLAQSLLAMLVFQSPFLALGPGFTRPQLLLYCLVVAVLQWWWSQAWLARRPHGPVEGHWRRFTHGSGKIEG